MLPRERGPVSAALIDALRLPPSDIDPALAGKLDQDDDEDLQLVLFVCYELHYGGFHGVDERWEWHPGLLELRAAAEERFEAALRRQVHVPDAPDVVDGLRALVAADDGPSLAGFLQRRATLAQFQEFVVHRSIYHLKEADPHTWGIPRLEGRAKAALVEIQMDEYGGGRLDRMHAQLFRDTMSGLDLDPRYGAYVDAVPAVTLATSNVISLFGLHRRRRGALAGHLAAFEMTSSLPNRRYGNGLRRLGLGTDVTRFYDEHVEADAVHEQIAAVDLCGSIAAAEPEQAGQILFGAACALALDARCATHLLDRWQAGLTSLSA
jgi:hypothetical protein